ncbi:MAG: type II toxin-antitoxin system Phd/YefM family antitoxin [Bacteroidales bacterium]|nr:type II toxin-antitoxin system Phd/YefM family antitoxin [Bacteroidales bacterium]
MIDIDLITARKNLSELIEKVNIESFEPVKIVDNETGKSAVLISEGFYNSILETNYINSIPKLSEKIIEEGKCTLEDCIPEDKIQW